MVFIVSTPLSAGGTFSVTIGKVGVVNFQGMRWGWACWWGWIFLGVLVIFDKFHKCGFLIGLNTVSDIKCMIQTPFMYSESKICNGFLFGLSTVSGIKCMIQTPLMYSESQIYCGFLFSLNPVSDIKCMHQKPLINIFWLSISLKLFPCNCPPIDVVPASVLFIDLVPPPSVPL